MSELIDNTRMKKDALKHLILELHRGAAPEAVRAQLSRMLGTVPYGVVVEVEQELIAEGVLPMEEVLRLCDIHSAAMKGLIEPPADVAQPVGHPVEVFRRENRALEAEVAEIQGLLAELARVPGAAPAGLLSEVLRRKFETLRTVDRHYRRKENLLFPYLEKRGITGPSQVMWGKDDEARDLLKSAVESLAAASQSDAGSLQAVASRVLHPALAAVKEMIFKEQEILLPMSLDSLTEAEWSAIAEQSAEIGWCLIPDPPGSQEVRVPLEAAGLPAEEPADEPEEGPRAGIAGGTVRLPSGTLSTTELLNVLNLLPFDLTFVDAEDRVRYFSQGPERVFDRNLAILGRRVQECHPPASVHVVQRIVDDFRAGRAERAPFWITLGDRFLHIEYFAVRDEEGRYLGTLEVTQDLTAKRALTGERRLLSHEALPHPPAAVGEAEGAAATGPQPDWFHAARVTQSLDARPMLKAGQHPAGAVQQAVQALGPGEIFELITPFEPAPLIERIRELGCRVWAMHPGDGTVRTYFRLK